MSAVELAVELAGTQAELARICGQKPQAITRWLRQGRVPPKHAPVIEAALGGRVTRRQLSPQFHWGDETLPAAQSQGAAVPA